MSEQQSPLSLTQFYVNLKYSQRTTLDDINELIDWRPIGKELKKSLRRTVNALASQLILT